MSRYNLGTLEATWTLGAELAASAKVGDIFALEGGLGVGKTELVRGFVRALNEAAAGEVASPTFAIVHEYATEPVVLHADLYRLEDASELDPVGGDELLDPYESIVLVEWASKFAAHFPAKTRWIRLHLEGGERWAELD